MMMMMMMMMMMTMTMIMVIINVTSHKRRGGGISQVIGIEGTIQRTHQHHASLVAHIVAQGHCASLATYTSDVH